MIQKQKDYIKKITDEEDEYTNRTNELRTNEIKLKEELDNVEIILANNVELCKKFKSEVKYV